MKPVIFLNSHPIQYFAPLYQHISANTDIDLEVVYCSDESLKGKMDKGFGTNVQWDIPLMDGYKSVFIKNRSFKPSIHSGFFGLFNPGIISYLRKKPKSILVIHGWAYATHIMAIIAGKLTGHTVCIRAETPQNQELLKNKYITFLKHLYLRFIFMFADKFLYVGKQNKLFYKALGKKETNLVFTPYSVDNKRFRSIFEETLKNVAREKLNLPAATNIILYSGKYITKKNPLDILKAFSLMDNENATLVMVGDGELRPQMETFITGHRLNDKVVLTGFINQSLIPLYYRAADVFVMCSGLGETWGLSVNEAMNFGLPVIVSDTCGSSYDLVKNEVNGRVFETGNIEQLQKAMEDFVSKPDADRVTISQNSLAIIDQYSYVQIAEGLRNI
ncbi:glycosyltransferase family 4 protein [Mucilaginibacter sp. HMF5004]|uniref:glycosyltransferase family 4 protein n=1 Tax=Mucilaginibacter rivuli TaxID=2857527 RepID=UPI001C5E86C3|nr:glycosyltransferase family 4 protein [Mucilaginibacter rivuli]MBW4890093.1 glycosyltransferase family 4 protein [Mucilaginibacter rivuli]